MENTDNTFRRKMFKLGRRKSFCSGMTVPITRENQRTLSQPNPRKNRITSWFRRSLPFMKTSKPYSDEITISDSMELTGWDEGLKTIDSILFQSRKLTREQKEGLIKLRKFLVDSGNSSRKSMHVPNTLLRASMDPKNSLSRYFVEDFGGVHNEGENKPKRSKVSFNGKKIGSDRSLEINKQIGNEDIKGSSSNYCPPEWDELDSQTKRKIMELLSFESLSKWDFNVCQLNDLCQGNSLLFMSWAVLGSPAAQESMARDCGYELRQDGNFYGYNFLEKFNFESFVLCNFARTVEADYINENPYHNSIHAADVTQTLHALLQMGAKRFANDLEIFSLLVASICHDVHHPGFNNNYHLNSLSDLAITYNDVSVLENMHASRTFRLMLQNEGQKVDIMSGLSKEQKIQSRKLITSAILHTDMTKHFQQIVNLKALIEANNFSLNSCRLNSNDSCTLLYCVLHAADISNPAKPSPLNTMWAKLVLKEFFKQGDVEKIMGYPISHLCDRDTTSLAESQIGFIKFIVQPTFEVMVSIIPALATEVMPIITQSKEYWEHEKLVEILCEEN